jgi:3-hydroxyacyl-[acyl-carrier-protein] dehydratase
MTSAPATARKLPMTAMDIRAILPHRMPFLMIDRVDELEPLKRIKGVKCVAHNEPFFQGHFPEEPVMPGVLQIEALAQAGAILALIEPENAGKIVYLAGVDGFKFRRPVVPGDVLTLEVEMLRYRKGRFGRARGIASVNGEISAEGELTFAMGADAGE